MRSLRYLNAILTVLTVLLALHLWTLWTGDGVGRLAPTSRVADAASRGAAGIPNSSAQRKEMVDLLKQQNRKTDELIGLFRSGTARVKLYEKKNSGSRERK